MRLDEVYQAALAAGSGGIRWNSETKYIQLADENKNWIDWQYYNPNEVISLVPVMSSAHGTRNDGVSIDLSVDPVSSLTSGSIYGPFTGTNSGGYIQIRCPSSYQISFSTPQIITYLEYRNWDSASSSGPHNVDILASNNGTEFSKIHSFSANSTNDGLVQVSIPNTVPYYSYRFYSAKGNYSGYGQMIYTKMDVRGYSYIGD